MEGILRTKSLGNVRVSDLTLCFVIFVPSHRRWMGSAGTDASANLELELGTEESLRQGRFIENEERIKYAPL